MDKQELYFATYEGVDFNSLPDDVPYEVYVLTFHHITERYWYYHNQDKHTPVLRSYYNLRDVHHLAPKAVKNLVEAGYLERDFYIVGMDFEVGDLNTDRKVTRDEFKRDGKPYGYWIPQHVIDSGFTTVSLSKSEVHPQRWSVLRDYHTIERDYNEHDYLYGFLSDVSIDPDDIDEFNPFAFHLLNGSYLFRRKWVGSNGSLSDGRLHSSFSLLPRSLKSKVTLERSPDLVEVDVSCSHAFLLAMLLTGKLQDSKTGCFTALTRSTSPSTSYYPYMNDTGVDKKCTQNYTDLTNYIHHATEGTVYGEIKKMMEGVYEHPTRDKAKKLFNAMLNTTMDDFLKYEIAGEERVNSKRLELYERMMDRWATVMKVVSENDGSLGTQLMQMEAGIMVDTVAERLKGFNFPFQMTHDGIYVGWNRAELVKDVVQNTYLELFNIHPMVKVKE